MGVACERLRLYNLTGSFTTTAATHLVRMRRRVRWPNLTRRFVACLFMALRSHPVLVRRVLEVTTRLRARMAFRGTASRNRRDRCGTQRTSRRETMWCPRRWRPSRADCAAWLRARAAPSLRRGSANHHAASHPFAETPRCSAPMLRFNPYALWASYARCQKQSADAREGGLAKSASAAWIPLAAAVRHRRAGTSYYKTAA